MPEELLAKSSYQELILSHLSDEDDAEFWMAAISVLFRDVEVDLAESRLKSEVYVQIGACSHWLRPHQTRWTAAGGFALPVGYGESDPGYSYSRSGLPEFDWSIALHQDLEHQTWRPVEKFAGKRHFIFRVALPTRTKRHPQAAIHTIWLPSRPSDGESKFTRFYGFRKVDGAWDCVATL
jgi:hypothetical protein